MQKINFNHSINPQNTIESNSELRNIVEKIIQKSLLQETSASKLKASFIETQLGTMIAIADEKALYLLEFLNKKHLEQGINRLQLLTKSTIIFGKTSHIDSIEQEINQYFQGQLQEFKTPIFLQGTPFQKMVWEELSKIPFGKTFSYKEIAHAMNKPRAFRAVALANSKNQFVILVPCHRVINDNGKLGGYAAGINKKEWLLAYEKSQSKKD